MVCGSPTTASKSILSLGVNGTAGVPTTTPVPSVVAVGGVEGTKGGAAGESAGVLFSVIGGDVDVGAGTSAGLPEPNALVAVASLFVAESALRLTGFCVVVPMSMSKPTLGTAAAAALLVALGFTNKYNTPSIVC